MVVSSIRLPPRLRLARLPSFATRFVSTQLSSATPLRSMVQHTKKHKVAVVGSGNWGSAIAKIIAENTRQHEDLFEPEVQMWVFEEKVTLPKTSKHYDGSSAASTEPQPLTKLINDYHENIKYLPDIPLPHNLIANPSIEDSVKNATILVFNLPHQFIAQTCDQLKGKVLPYARGISCIKGLDVSEEGIQLYTDSIASKLGIYCGALSGANIANEVAAEKWSETTIAYAPPKQDCQQGSPTGSPPPSPKLSPQGVKLQSMPCDYPPLSHENVKALFHRPYFHVRVVDDVAGVCLGGALKNVVALAAGFVDGLGWGDNAKAAVMRVGLLEQVKFGQTFFPESFREETLTEESCGIADMITSCSGGRNFRCAKLSIQRGVHIDEVEKTELNGQKLQGTHTASDVNSFLKTKKMEDDYPLFTAVYNILKGTAKPEDIPALLVGESRHGRPKM